LAKGYYSDKDRTIYNSWWRNKVNDTVCAVKETAFEITAQADVSRSLHIHGWVFTRKDRNGNDSYQESSNITEEKLSIACESLAGENMVDKRKDKKRKKW
jgi:hypothetical protein